MKMTGDAALQSIVKGCLAVNKVKGEGKDVGHRGDSPSPRSPI